MTISAAIILLLVGLHLLGRLNHQRYVAIFAHDYPTIKATRQYYRLFTYALIHDNFTHLMMNCACFATIGVPVENKMHSPVVYIACLVGSAIFVGAFLCYTSVKFQRQLTIGASGVGFALLTMYAFYFPGSIMALFFIIPIPIVILLPGLLFYSVLRLFRPGGSQISHAAHLGGILIGLLLGIMLHSDLSSTRRQLSAASETIYSSAKAATGHLIPQGRDGKGHGHQERETVRSHGHKSGRK